MHLKRQLRAIVDRVARPYVDEIVVATANVGAPANPAPAVESPSEESEAFAGVPSDFFHALNHELRTRELERIPKGARRALSVGANGRWYFDWFEAAVGELDRHVGIEAFEPMPPDLPPYVEWVANTADHMVGVADGGVDLVFAGQTTEHLWADELSGFLLEAHRVLASNGLLVLDSPNRLVTEHLLWSHGGHTVELSSDEIKELLALAGFEVETTRGVWRCRFDDQVLALETGLNNGATLVRRITDAPDNVDDSFIWWIVARRLEGEPHVEDLERRTREIFAVNWPRRVTRGLPVCPHDASITIGTDSPSCAGVTLPFPLHAGTWELGITATSGELRDLDLLEVRFVAPGGAVIHHLSVLNAVLDGPTASWRFAQDWLVFGLTMEVHARSLGANVTLGIPFQLVPVV